jgi:hypothetical protein
MATAVAIAPRSESSAVRSPNPWLLGAIVVVGCAVPVRSIALALTSDGVDLVQVALLDWITVPFILAGLVAWVRRPESRLGPLMIGGGFASGLSALQLTTSTPSTRLGPSSTSCRRRSSCTSFSPFLTGASGPGSSECSFRPPTRLRSVFS